MSDTTEMVALTLNVSPELLARIDATAADFRESREAFLLRAVEQFIADDEYELETTKQALVRAKAGGPVIENERVMAWLESLGTDHELPPPRCD